MEQTEQVEKQNVLINQLREENERLKIRVQALQSEVNKEIVRRDVYSDMVDLFLEKLVDKI